MSRVALVTGGGTGIGAAVARRLAGRRVRRRRRPGAGPGRSRTWQRETGALRSSPTRGVLADAERAVAETVEPFRRPRCARAQAGSAVKARCVDLYAGDLRSTSTASNVHRRVPDGPGCHSAPAPSGAEPFVTYRLRRRPTGGARQALRTARRRPRSRCSPGASRSTTGLRACGRTASALGWVRTPMADGEMDCARRPHRGLAVRSLRNRRRRRAVAAGEHGRRDRRNASRGCSSDDASLRQRGRASRVDGGRDRGRRRHARRSGGSHERAPARRRRRGLARSLHRRRARRERRAVHGRLADRRAAARARSRAAARARRIWRVEPRRRTPFRPGRRSGAAARRLPAPPRRSDRRERRASRRGRVPRHGDAAALADARA